MKKEYDFSKSQKNPYLKKLKQQVTINLFSDTVTYFKDLSEETGIPYQHLIRLFLQDCAEKKKKPKVKWGA